MSNNIHKTPLAFSLPKMAYGRADRRLSQLGKALPAHVVSNNNSMVTVQFDVAGTDYANLPQVTIPLYGCEYIRYPIVSGCKGVVFSADVRIGITTGLGNHVYDFTQPGNLTSLYFMPMANTAWSETDNPNAVVIYGPDGVVMRDTGNTANMTILPGSISLTAGGHSIVISSAGVVIDGRAFLTHQHSGVTTGANDTAGVV